MKVLKILPESEIFSNVEAERFKTTYEAGIILQTIKHLLEMNPDFYSEFCIVILFNAGLNIEHWHIEYFSDKRKIYIIFDENGRIPEELCQHKPNIVFHSYLSFEEKKKRYSNLFHYPLGCNSFVPETPFTRSTQRKVNVFYSGNLHIGRKKLYHYLTHLHFLPFPLLTRFQKLVKLEFNNKFPSSYIQFTNGFSKGLTVSEYAMRLSDSKILLSPPGISNLECFRHYEGLRAGCVVIAEQLPNKPQLKDSPIIEVKNWSNGFATVRELLRDPEKLDDLSRQSFSWYSDKLAPKPVARYIFDSIETIKKFL